jgi:DNA-binding MarR family transcriptional regulator
MTSKITRRQQTFLSQFLDLYRELDGPIHYGAVADRLGIGRVTAYEMLRLLEKRGLVQSEFHLPEGKRGPGRATVLFRPTSEADRVLRQLAGETDVDNDWEKIKTHILEQLQQGKAAGYEMLLNDLLNRIPKQRNPLVYLAEMTTALFLILQTYLAGSIRQRLRKHLRRIGSPGEIGLSVLAGVGMTLALMEQANRRVSSFLLSEINKYQQLFIDATEENRRRLNDFAREVMKIVSI